MNHFGHILVGLGAGFVIPQLLASMGLFSFNLPLTSFIAVAALGALLPDIDLKKSKVSKVVQLVFVVGGAVVLQPLLLGFFPLLVSWVVALAACAVGLFLILFPLRLKHRGVTHTFGAAVIFTLAVVIAAGIGLGIVGFAAYGSHVVVDQL